MMFASDGYLTQSSSGSTATRSQTHVFSSFPDSAVDLDDDGPIDLGSNANPSYAYNSSSTIEPIVQSSSPPTDNPSPESTRFWQIEFYQKYFSIDTKDILDRLAASITPKPDKSHFIASIRLNPDLYGPLWICITLILTVGIGSNVTRYFHRSTNDFQLDLSKITLSATFICLYCALMPTSLYFFFRWRLRREEYFLLELICIYGYSLTIFIPISILWIIQIHWLQWIFMLIASFISSTVLIVVFWPKMATDPKSLNTLVILSSLLLHLLMAIGLMSIFFRS